MLFKPACKGGVFFLLIFAVAGCATITPQKRSQTLPAVIAENGSCHGAIEVAMKTMTGSDRIRLSADVFRSDPMVLISNFLPSELSHGATHQFSEAADRRFLLHMKKGRCFLSLVNEDNRLTATQQLDACTCIPAP